MPSTDILSLLNSRFSAEQQKQIVLALHQDELVWKAVSDSGNNSIFETRSWLLPTDWSASNIALAMLAPELNAVILQSEELVPLPVHLRRDCIHAFENALIHKTVPDDIRQAGMLALAFRERFLLKGNWQGLRGELLASCDGDESGYVLFSRWKTSISIAVGLIPNVEGFYADLLGQGNLPGIKELAIHTILCRPGDSAYLASQIKELFINRLPGGILSILEYLEKVGRSDIASELALLVKDDSRKISMDLFSGSESGPFSILNDLFGKVVSASLAKSAGEMDRAGELFTEALKDLDRSTVAVARMGGKQIDHPVMQDKGLPPTSGEINTHPYNQLKAFCDTGDSNPLFIGEVECTAKTWLKTIVEDPWNALPEYHNVSEIPQIIKKVNDFGLLSLAKDILVNLLVTYPSRSDLWAILRDILLDHGDLSAAEQMARSVCLVEPERIDNVRQLAKIAEKAGNSDLAYSAWTNIVHAEEDAVPLDYYAHGLQAIKHHDAAAAIKSGEQLLSKKPDYGPGYYLLGEAFVLNNEKPRAIDVLTQATLLDEENPKAWILLASQYAETKQTEKALAILKEAALVLPDNLEILKLLANAYLSEGAYVDGLPYLKKVVAIDPSDGSSVVQLGQVLQKLGKNDEAHDVIERGYSYLSEYPPLAYELASSYLAKDKPERALPLLEKLSKTGDVEYGWLIKFIENALGKPGTTPPFIHDKGVEIASILNAIEKAKKLMPDNFELDFYLACIHTIAHENEKALELFQSLIKNKEFENPEWRWKIQSGIAINALAVKQPEKALVALEDVLAIRPGEWQMHRLLASVCLDLNLAKEGMQAAKYVVEQSPLDADTMNWFTNIATRFGAYSEAVQATEKLIAWHPDNAAHWYRLAQIHLLTGDFDLAKSSLSQFISMKGAPQTQLMDAAAAFIQMRDIPKALMAVERIKELDCRNPIHEWDEALLYMELNDIDRASAALNHALDEGMHHPLVSIFRAGLSAADGKYADATRLLNDVIVDFSSFINMPLPGGLVISSGFDIPTWLVSLTHKDNLLTQQIQYLYQSGDYHSAYQLATEAVHEFPGSSTLRFWKVLLGTACLAGFSADDLLCLGDQPDDNELWVYLSCTAFDHVMRIGNTQEAIQIMQKTAAVAALNPRVLAGQSRLLALDQNVKSAEQVYQQALTSRNRSGKMQFPGFGWPHHDGLYEDEENLWMGESLLDIRYWEDGITRILNFYHSHPTQPRAIFALIKAMLMFEEEKEVFQFIQSTQHIPEAFKVNGMTYSEIILLVDELEKMCGNDFGAELKARIDMIYQPSPIHLRNLAPFIESPTAMKSYLIGIKRLGFKTGSILIEGNYPISKQNAPFYALSYMDVDPKKAFEIIKPDPDFPVEDPVAVVIYGMIARDCDNLPEAANAYNKALAIWPDEPVWHFTAGKLSCELGDRQGTLVHFEDAFHLDENNSEYILAYASELVSQKMYDQAKLLLDRTWLNDEDAYEGYLLLANSLIGLNNNEAAYQITQKALQVKPDSIDALLKCAYLASDVDELQRAMRYCREVIKILPGHEETILLLVNLIEKLEGKAIALKTLDSLIQPARQPELILAKKAKLLLEVSGARAALPYFQELVWKINGNLDYLTSLANIQIEIGDFNSAERTVTDALVLDVDNPNLNRMMAFICHKNGQLDRAVHHFSDAIRLDPSAIDTYLQLAEIYKDRREYQEALHVYQKAMRIAVKDYRPYFHAGQVMKECKDYIGAEAMYRQAVELNPEDLHVKRQLGAIIALNLVHNCQEASVRA